MALLMMFVVPALAQEDLDCIDFDSQAEAQAVLDADPSDPNNLDADEDGQACESIDYGSGSIDYSPRGTASVTFALTVTGTPPANAFFYALAGPPNSDAIGFVRLTDPDGDGGYTAEADVPVNPDEEVAYACAQTEGEADLSEAFAGIFFPANNAEGFEVAVAEDGGTLECSSTFGDTGDDQQDTDSGKTPDNQQTDGTVTKTFKFTLDGTVPEGEAFGVVAGVQGSSDEPFFELFCGTAASVETQGECSGEGHVFTVEFEFPMASTIEYSIRRYPAGGGTETFHSGTETLNTDVTNTAWYSFGTGAGDDQQGEMPGEMPDTGAGGIATASTIPVGTAAAGMAMLSGAGYAVLRRR